MALQESVVEGKKKKSPTGGSNSQPYDTFLRVVRANRLCQPGCCCSLNFWINTKPQIKDDESDEKVEDEKRIVNRGNVSTVWVVYCMSLSQTSRIKNSEGSLSA